MAVMVEKAPTGLQPYLKLMRIDKPIGKKRDKNIKRPGKKEKMFTTINQGFLKIYTVKCSDNSYYNKALLI